MQSHLSHRASCAVPNPCTHVEEIAGLSFTDSSATSKDLSQRFAEIVREFGDLLSKLEVADNRLRDSISYAEFLLANRRSLEKDGIFIANDTTPMNCCDDVTARAAERDAICSSIHELMNSLAQVATQCGVDSVSLSQISPAVVRDQCAVAIEVMDRVISRISVGLPVPDPVMQLPPVAVMHATFAETMQPSASDVGAITAPDSRHIESIATPAPVEPPIANRDTFTVRWQGHECPLGNTKLFRMCEVLAADMGKYVPAEKLIDMVWDGEERGDSTIRKAASALRKKLLEYQMDLTIDGSQRGHYTLRCRHQK